MHSSSDLTYVASASTMLITTQNRILQCMNNGLPHLYKNFNSNRVNFCIPHLALPEVLHARSLNSVVEKCVVKRRGRPAYQDTKECISHSSQSKVPEPSLK